MQKMQKGRKRGKMTDYIRPRYINKTLRAENAKAYLRFERVKMIALSVLVHVVVLLIVMKAK